MPQKKYSIEFKIRCAKAAKAMKKGKLETSDIALSLGVANSLINKWIRAYDNNELIESEQNLDRTNNEIGLIYDLQIECLKQLKEMNGRIDSLHVFMEATK